VKGLTRLSRHPLVRRLLRYSSVSVVSTITSFTVLGLLVGIDHMGAILANVIATGVATVPSFELNRRWVWRSDGQRSLSRQILPFSTISFAGLGLSTLTVHLASLATAHSSTLLHTGAVEVASLGAYGCLWVVQYVVCARFVFNGPASQQLGAADER
jgi:putative flippase GtrA